MFWVVLAFLASAPIFFFSPFLLLFIISTTLFSIGVSQLRQYNNLPKWKQTKGKLIKAGIGKYSVTLGQYSPPEANYYPLVCFSYSHKGYEGKSNKYAFDTKSIWSTDMQSVKRVLTEIEMQELLKVYVNPKHPDEAVLNITISSNRRSHSWALTVSGVLLACVGGLVWKIT